MVGSVKVGRVMASLGSVGSGMAGLALYDLARHVKVCWVPAGEACLGWNGKLGRGKLWQVRCVKVRPVAGGLAWQEWRVAFC